MQLDQDKQKIVRPLVRTWTQGILLTACLGVGMYNFYAFGPDLHALTGRMQPHRLSMRNADSGDVVANETVKLGPCDTGCTCGCAFETESFQGDLALFKWPDTRGINDQDWIEIIVSILFGATFVGVFGTAGTMYVLAFFGYLKFYLLTLMSSSLYTDNYVFLFGWDIKAAVEDNHPDVEWRTNTITANYQPYYRENGEMPKQDEFVAQHEYNIGMFMVICMSLGVGGCYIFFYSLGLILELLGLIPCGIVAIGFYMLVITVVNPIRRGQRAAIGETATPLLYNAVKARLQEDNDPSPPVDIPGQVKKPLQPTSFDAEGAPVYDTEAGVQYYAGTSMPTMIPAQTLIFAGVI